MKFCIKQVVAYINEYKLNKDRGPFLGVFEVNYYDGTNNKPKKNN